MVYRSRSWGSSHSYTGSSSYTGTRRSQGRQSKSNNNTHEPNPWYFRAKSAYNDDSKGVHFDPDDSILINCESKLSLYERCMQVCGKDDSEVISMRKALIDKCGAYFHPDDPSSFSHIPRFQPDQDLCYRYLRDYMSTFRIFGKDDPSTSADRKFLIDKCGAYFHPDEAIKSSSHTA